MGNRTIQALGLKTTIQTGRMLTLSNYIARRRYRRTLQGRERSKALGHRMTVKPFQILSLAQGRVPRGLNLSFGEPCTKKQVLGGRKGESWVGGLRLYSIYSLERVFGSASQQLAEAQRMIEPTASAQKTLRRLLDLPTNTVLTEPEQEVIFQYIYGKTLSFCYVWSISSPIPQPSTLVTLTDKVTYLRCESLHW
jgi:hypothetical protein